MYAFCQEGGKMGRKEGGWEEARMRKKAITTVRVWHEHIIIITLILYIQFQSDQSLFCLPTSGSPHYCKISPNLFGTNLFGMILPALSMGTAHVLQAPAAIHSDRFPTPDRNFQTILPLALLFPPSTFSPTSLPNKTLCIL